MAKPLKLEPLKLEPLPGEWYRGKGDPFEVIAYDEEEGSIEIQYFDGTLEELDVEDWREQAGLGTLQSSEAPDDYAGAYDFDSDEEEEFAGRADDYDSASGGLRASGLDALDLFE